MALRIDVVFDVPADRPSYRATLSAIDHALAASGGEADVRVVRTNSIDNNYLAEVPDAVVIGPGAPYDKPLAAELVVAGARERGVPLVGT